MELKELINKLHNFGRKELIYWSNALAGEIGELCNLVKKFYRDNLKDNSEKSEFEQIEYNYFPYNQMKEEIADIFIYLGLISRDILKFDLEEEVLKKLNKIKERRFLNGK